MHCLLLSPYPRREVVYMYIRPTLMPEVTLSAGACPAESSAASLYLSRYELASSNQNAAYSQHYQRGCPARMAGTSATDRISTVFSLATAWRMVILYKRPVNGSTRDPNSAITTLSCLVLVLAVATSRIHYGKFRIQSSPSD